MRADLDDTRAVEDDDEVGHADGRESVRDEDRDPALCLALTRSRCRGVALEQRMLRLSIERGCGLVEDKQERFVAHETASERKLLPLSE